MRERKEIVIAFKNARKKNLIGILHLPDREKPPLVIICHGFDGTKTDKKFVELARFLQKEGIATFRFDFEGCGDSEGKFEEMTIEKEASALNSALKAVLKRGDFDSKRVGFVGYSLGGVVATLFIRNFDFPAKTMVFWSQAFNQKELFKIWHKRSEIKKWERKGFLVKGDKKLGKEYLKENKNRDWSFLLSEIPGIPIFLIHGKKDEDVPLKFSERLAKSYKNIKLKVLNGADHKFKEFYCRKKLIRLTVGWLRKHL